MEVYKWRHLIENFFQKLKEFKRIAMRAYKTDTSFEAMIHIGRLCCTNPVRDSSRESSVVAGLHEQTHTPRLQDQELA